MIYVGESALDKYYSLDIDTGKVSTRRLGSGANVIIGVNGKERLASRIAEEEDSDDDEYDSKHQIVIINITINIDIINIFIVLYLLKIYITRRMMTAVTEDQLSLIAGDFHLCKW